MPQRSLSIDYLLEYCRQPVLVQFDEIGGGWYRTAGSGTNVSVAAPGDNDGKPWRDPFSPDSNSDFSVVGSMLPLALVGCGSIFMGEISMLMNRAGRLRLGVPASVRLRKR